MTTDSLSPFDDVRELTTKSAAPDEAAMARVREALLGMGRARDFGRLGDAAAWLAGWQKRYPPRVQSPTLAVFAGSHGLAAKGVTLSTDARTSELVASLKEGGAPLSAIAASVDTNIRVFELAIERPTPSIDEAPAMSEKECAATIAYGFEAVTDKPDLLALAVSGAGIGTAAAGVACALYGGSPDYWVRPGPGVPDEVTGMRAELVTRALSCHRGHQEDPLDILRCFGGRELAACVGAIIAARLEGVPVVLDGFATTIAAGVVHALSPNAIEHVLAGHVTRRPAHQAALERMGLEPLLHLDFQTGAGLGSTAAIGLLQTACAPFIAQPTKAG